MSQVWPDLLLGMMMYTVLYLDCGSVLIRLWQPSAKPSHRKQNLHPYRPQFSGIDIHAYPLTVYKLSPASCAWPKGSCLFWVFFYIDLSSPGLTALRWYNLSCWWCKVSRHVLTDKQNMHERTLTKVFTHGRARMRTRLHLTAMSFTWHLFDQ